MKTCSKCKASKPLSEFSKNKSKTLGVNSECKECSCAYRASNREERRARTAFNKATIRPRERACKKCGIHFATHRCEICHKASSAAYAANNKTRVQEYQAKYLSQEHIRLRAVKRARDYVLKNYELVRMQKQEYAKANSEQAVAIVAAWRKKNPDAKRIDSHNRRQRMKGRLSKGLGTRLYAAQEGLCACCGAELNGVYHMDHKMPLALGGANTDDNIQLLTPKCNSQKSAKHPEVFMRERAIQALC